MNLEGERVTLEPLREDHAEALLTAAADGALWTSKVTIVPDADTVQQYITSALALQARGTARPFVTVVQGRVVGSTRFWNIDTANRKLEIGGTWLAASWQRSFVNTEAKYIMLRHAFEALGCVRVQFTTDELNTRSRDAILRLGAKLEGCLRNERIMPDGRIRNSLHFSILDSEWPDVKARLLARL
jgi:RimJ/RimL family protein N-acetyltransferase